MFDVLVRYSNVRSDDASAVCGYVRDIVTGSGSRHTLDVRLCRRLESSRYKLCMSSVGPRTFKPIPENTCNGSYLCKPAERAVKTHRRLASRREGNIHSLVCASTELSIWTNLYTVKLRIEEYVLPPLLLYNTWKHLRVDKTV